MRYNLIFFVLISGFIFNISCVEGSRKGRINDNNSAINEVVKEDILSLESDSVEQVVLFSQCSDNNNSLSTVTSEIQFIPLGIEPPINDFHILDIELSDDYIFMLGSNQILQYDKNGKFIKKIGSCGMGPGEFIQLLPPLQLDRDKQLIYAFDESLGRIFIYQFDGTFKGVIPLNLINGNICIIDSTRIAIRQRDYTRFATNSQSICFVDYKGKKVKSYPSYIYPFPKEKKEHFGPNSNFLWQNNDKLYSLEYGSDTIFRIQKDSLIPVCVLSGKLKLDRDELFIRDTGGKLALCSYMQRPNSGIFESNKFILFRMSSVKEVFFMVYNKQTKKFHRTFHEDAPLRFENRRTDYFTDDIVSGLSFNPQYQSQGWAIALIPAMDIDEKRNDILEFIAKHPSQESEKLKKIVQNITEMDNSLIMFVKFK